MLINHDKYIEYDIISTEKEKGEDDIANHSTVHDLLIHYIHEKGQTTGYEFLKACRLRGIEVSPGSVYPLLNKLREQGLLTSRREGRRIVYQFQNPYDSDRIAGYREGKVRKKRAQRFQMLAVCICRGLDERSREAIQSFIRGLADTEWADHSQVNELIQSIQKMSDSLLQYNKQNKTTPKQEGEL